ncbi:unnamed protein product [Allacma fusca]|uniref:Phenoloxidase-activating factor 2 n=1 Tax=Allacma fusca TaxID=39272 RepID=A0A8J2MA33_9HEXA|nr:unnamed protein product [Allacma fusca]
MARHILIALFIAGLVVSDSLSYSVIEKDSIPASPEKENGTLVENSSLKTATESSSGEVITELADETVTNVPETTRAVVDRQDRKEPEGTLPPNYVASTPVPVTNSSKVYVTQEKDVAIIKGVNPDKKSGTCFCGTPLPNKIVGGEQALIKEYPWTVGILRRGFLGFGGSSKPFCGGTLVNDRYVVTASHCVDGQLPSNLQILLKEQDLAVDQETLTKKVDVAEIIMHEGYDRRTIDNDIALIKLESPVTLSEEFIRPACLPANNENDFDGLVATAAGWGTTSQGGSQSSVLLKVAVPIISNKVCNSNETKYQGKISPNMICAGVLGVGGKDACQGDSGGPLTIPNGGRTTLIGVVSWGYGCAKADSPGVYTRVARYPDWILRHTSDATWCS